MLLEGVGKSAKRVELDVALAVFDRVERWAADVGDQAEIDLREAVLNACSAHVFGECLLDRRLHTTSVANRENERVNRALRSG